MGRKAVPKVRAKNASDAGEQSQGDLEVQGKALPEVQGDGEHLGDHLDSSDEGGAEEAVGPSGIVWHTEKRRVGDLTEWDRNPRRLTESQAKHIATSIIKFGLVEEPQVNLDNEIIGGHQRTRVMLQAGLIHHDSEIDVRVPSRLLSEQEHEELAIRLNKNTGDWDWEALTTHFDQSFLRDVGFSPMDFGLAATKGTDFGQTPTPVEPMQASGLKPGKPRICTHCDNRCHCVVEE